jgi:putative ABC transport system permease protein
MTTSVRERPAPALPVGGDGGAPARQAVIRWAWRLFRREWREQLLVLSLITVAVAGTVLGAAVASNTPSTLTAATFGTANHLVMFPGSQPHLAADIAAIRRQFGPVDVIENQALVTGSASQVQLRAQNPVAPYGQPTLALVSGHYPHGPGQVALTSQVADLYNTHVGGIWHQGGTARRVVGRVENPGNLADKFALVAPGHVGTPAEVAVLFDATSASAAAFDWPANAAVQTPPPSSGMSPAFIVLAAATLGLIFVGLVSVASFTVLARRRLRALGMLGSLGAADRNIALVLTANGAITGTAGAIAGAAAGFAAWMVYRPHLEASAGHRIGVLHVPWPVIGTGMVLAVLTCILASRRPARTAARMPVHAALAERPQPPRAARRSALPGVILLLAGPVLLFASGGWGHNGGTATLETLGGLTATVFGGLLLAPFCLTALAQVAKRAPVAARLALRDLSRYRARSAAALSAISFAVLLAALIGILAAARYASPLDYTGPNLAANQLLLYPPGHTAGPSAAPPSAQNGIGDLPARLADVLGTPAVLTLDSATRPGLRMVAPSGQDLGPITATLNQAGTPTNNYSGPLYVATPALLRYFGIRPSQIDPAADVLTIRPGLAAEPRMQFTLPVWTRYGPPSNPDACPDGRCVTNPRIQTITGLPAGTSAPNTVITTHAMNLLGLQPIASAWLFQTSRPLTTTQINGARQLAAAASATIETRSGEVSLSQILSAATAVGILIALGVLAMTVGLIRSETASDLRTLAATGAGGATRRNLTAATAGTLGLLGALTGTALAYLTAISWFRHASVIASTAPVPELAVILAGLPLAAAIGGWLFAGRQPPAIARQPLE